jgi:hypothetical protein
MPGPAEKVVQGAGHVVVMFGLGSHRAVKRFPGFKDEINPLNLPFSRPSSPPFPLSPIQIATRPVLQNPGVLRNQNSKFKNLPRLTGSQFRKVKESYGRLRKHNCMTTALELL